MGGRRRTPARATGPRCRGVHQVFTCPIDRRLRLCTRVGTQHLFVVACRRSCVLPDASGLGGAASAGGAMRVRAACAACGCGCCCGGVCAAAVAVAGARGVEGARVAAAWCARRARRGREAGFLSHLRAGCARVPLFLCSRCRRCRRRPSALRSRPCPRGEWSVFMALPAARVAQQRAARRRCWRGAGGRCRSWL